MDRLEELRAEETAKPLAFIMHDTATTRGDTAYSLVAAGGWAYYGLYVAVRDIVAGRPGHRYPIADGGKRLGWELHNLPEADLEAFLGTLRAVGAVDREAWERGELGLVEVDAAAEHRAAQSAPKRLAAERTNAKRSAQRDA